MYNVHMYIVQCKYTTTGTSTKSENLCVCISCTSMHTAPYHYLLNYVSGCKTYSMYIVQLYSIYYLCVWIVTCAKYALGQSHSSIRTSESEVYFFVFFTKNYLQNILNESIFIFVYSCCFSDTSIKCFPMRGSGVALYVKFISPRYHLQRGVECLTLFSLV